MSSSLYPSVLWWRKPRPTTLLPWLFSYRKGKADPRASFLGLLLFLLLSTVSLDILFKKKKKSSLYFSSLLYPKADLLLESRYSSVSYWWPSFMCRGVDYLSSSEALLCLEGKQCSAAPHTDSLRVTGSLFLEPHTSWDGVTVYLVAHSWAWISILFTLWLLPITL